MAVAGREIMTAGDARPIPWRCPRDLFYRMGDLGFFEGQRVILIEGEILVMPAMGNRHRTTVTLASDALRQAFGDGFFVSVQSPFDIGQATDPEPDIAVVAGHPRDYLDRGLTEAALIVEVSDSTLAYDRGEKARLYARAGVGDYWVINLNDSQVEVHRQPVMDGQTFGGYREVTVFHAGQSLHPLAKHEVRLAVADLLP